MACKGCHQKIVESFVQTAHFRTSAQANAETVKGHVADGHNVLRTQRPNVYFKVENTGGAFYQTGVDSAQSQSRTERMDLVIGSGRVGQTYLYWKEGSLFELPVSYLTGADAWINSPGYPDGRIDFGRIITPRCLECHSTRFNTDTSGGRAPRYLGDYMLGISCAKCHGSVRRHLEYQTAHPAETRGKYMLNPASFSRERKLDNCALCHSGAREPSAPAFAYKPGERLDEYFAPQAERIDSLPDVHGNQVGLLRRSRCFRNSPEMSCSSCHDVHQPQRDVTQLAKRCLQCHQAGKHKMAEKIGSRMMTECINCHMPEQKTKAIRINTATKEFSPLLRSHLIGIYPAVADSLLRSPARAAAPPRSAHTPSPSPQAGSRVSFR